MRRFLVFFSLAVLVFPSGCAVRNIANEPPPEQAIGAADQLMDAYLKFRKKFFQAWPTLTNEQKEWAGVNLVPVLNAAKPAVAGVADAAAAWKICSAEDSADAEAKYQLQKRVAEGFMSNLLELWTQLKGSRE